MLTAWLILHILVSLFLLANARRALRARNVRSTEAKVLSGVSVIFPIRGNHEHLETCLASWLKQDFAREIEYLFSLQDEQDPALPLVQKLRESFKDPEKISILINPVLPGFSGKGSNLHHAYQKAKYDSLVFSDADIQAEPTTLKELLYQLETEKTLVSALPVHTEALNIWAKVYQYTWNTVLISLWAPGMLDKRSPGVAGGTLAFHKSLLESIGGIQAFGSYLAEDLVLGSLVHKQGGTLKLGPIVKSPVGKISFEKLVQDLRRSHLIANHYNGLSRTMGLIAILIGSAYSLLPLLAFLFQRADFLFVWLMFVSFRMWYFIAFDRVTLGVWRINLAFILGDFISCSVYLNTLFNSKVRWGNVEHRIARGTKIL